MSSTVLVINSGSSSLKFQLVEPVAGMSRAAGIVERIGERSSPVADHAQALHRAFKMLAEDGIDLQTCGLVAVGHRVVHGGTEFHQPTLLDDTVIGKLEELSALAPLHNPRRLAYTTTALATRRALGRSGCHESTMHGRRPVPQRGADRGDSR